MYKTFILKKTDAILAITPPFALCACITSGLIFLIKKTSFIIEDRSRTGLISLTIGITKGVISFPFDVTSLGLFPSFLQTTLV